ncbi:MAG: C2HC-type zinc finger protein, partial [Rhabdochlamydiaceae bacterium]
EQTRLLMEERDEYRDSCARMFVAQNSASSNNSSSNSDGPKKLSSKLTDPDKLTDGKDPEFEHWLSRMTRKLKVNADHFQTELSKIAYIENRTAGAAAKHLGPRMRDEHPEKYTTANEVFSHLKEIYEDSNKLENSKKAFRKLYMSNSDDYHEFSTKFLHLSGEAQVSKEDYKSEFRSKLSLDMKRMVAVGYRQAKDFKEFQEMCNDAAQTLKDEAAITAVKNRFKKKDTKDESNTKKNDNSNKTPKPAAPAAGGLVVNEKEKLKKEGRCFKCKAQGHMARDCLEDVDTAMKELEMNSENESA